MKFAVISDIHSNLEALERILDALPEIDGIWCLGDIVGYGGQPGECIKLLHSLPMPFLATAGNHDLGSAGLLDLAAFNPEGREAIEWTRPRLSPKQIEWLKRPERLQTPDGQSTLLHGSPRNPIWEYVTANEIASACFPYFDTDICFFGHTHIPMIYAKKDNEPSYKFMPAAETCIHLADLGDRWMINPGSAGQPRDRDPRASFLIFDSEEMSVIWHRIEYPYEATRAKIRAAGLPAVLGDRLAYGI